jgi:hypothetical protein
LLLGYGLRRFPPRRLLSPRLIAYGDQERCDVFAVVAGLLKGGAAAFGRNSVSAQLDRRQIWIGIRALDASRCVGLADLQISNDLALLVIQAA